MQTAVLGVPDGVVGEAIIRISVTPAFGAVLIHSEILGKEPIRFDGPFQVGFIPIISDKISFELANGTESGRIETIGWVDFRDTKKHDDLANKNYSISAEEERQKFYSSIGFAISQWQHLEAALARIFIFLVSAQDSAAANAAFFTIVNFSAKLAIVDAAAKNHLDGMLLSEWEKLHKKINDKSSIRNKLAHYMSVIRINSKDECRYYLEPNIYDVNQLKKTNNKKYNYKNIEDHARSFGGISQELIGFLSGLAANSIPLSLPR